MQAIAIVLTTAVRWLYSYGMKTNAKRTKRRAKSPLVEVEASAFFQDENENWKYCVDHATFVHKEACEFIIHCGDVDFRKSTAERMKRLGCTEDFIAAYLRAATKAVRVLFYV